MTAGSLQQLLDDIRAQIAAGNRIEAIKIYREATGAGLAEAKEAVELIAAGKPPRADGAATPDQMSLQRIKAEISAGNPIEAIRLYRAATGLGLKESKDAVEILAFELNPDAAASRDAAMRRMRRMAVIAALVFVGLVASVILLSRLS